MKQDVEFDAEGVTLRGWLYVPDAVAGLVPAVVMAVGRSAPQQNSCQFSPSATVTPASSRALNRGDTCLTVRVNEAYSPWFFFSGTVEKIPPMHLEI